MYGLGATFSNPNTPKAGDYGTLAAPNVIVRRATYQPGVLPSSATATPPPTPPPAMPAPEKTPWYVIAGMAGFAYWLYTTRRR